MLQKYIAITEHSYSYYLIKYKKGDFIMANYKVIYHWTDGTEDEDDNYGEFYESEEAANELKPHSIGWFYFDSRICFHIRSMWRVAY
jgi:hypothetical protein